MGQVDKILQGKIADVNSMMKSHLSRVGFSTSNFSGILSEAVANSNAQAGSSVLMNNTAAKASTSSGNFKVLPNENAYNDLINQAAVKYNLDPNLIKSVMRLESQFKRKALSCSGAMGLMQLMPGTAASLGVTDAYDPEQNIDGGAKYLRKQINRFGDVRLALAGYYTGPNRVAGYGITNLDDEEQYNRLPENVRSYIERVINNYIQYTNQSQS